MGTIVQAALLVSTVPAVPLWMQNVEYRVLVRFKPELTCTGIYTSVLPPLAFCTQWQDNLKENSQYEPS